MAYEIDRIGCLMVGGLEKGKGVNISWNRGNVILVVQPRRHSEA